MDKLTDRQKKMVLRLIQIYKDYWGWELEAEDAQRIRFEKVVIAEALGLLDTHLKDEISMDAPLGAKEGVE